MPPSVDELMARFTAATAGMDPFEHYYVDARELEAARRRGDHRKIKELDSKPGTMAHCIRCQKPCIDTTTMESKPMICSGCKGVVYCSRSCQVADWKKSIMPNQPSHKELCASNKEHMKRVGHFQSQSKQFPWMRIGPDGTSSHNLIKAQLGVLGSGPSFGYWSVPGGLQPHDNSDTIRGPPMPNLKGAMGRAKGYVHGQVLLGDEWPTDIEAWKLKDETHVPRLFFTDTSPPPPKVNPGDITDWRAWYEWRGIPLDSPAALLMDYPLSVYHLLVNVLNVVDRKSTPRSRQALEVHYIGAEVELNFLPLFSEIALLLPNTDVTLVMFGKAPYDLIQTARKDYRGSLATQDVVWTYTAPKKTGAGSIQIKLHSESDLWSRQVLADGSHPDALLGLNAGLLAYSTWMEPMAISAILDIPFAITEYAEQSMDTCAKHLPSMLAYQAAQLTGPEGQPGSPTYKALTRTRSYPIAPNPFFRPGQRQLGMLRMPNSWNAFTMPVVLGAQ